MSPSVKEDLASPNPGQKLLEDVGRVEGCFKTLADYSQVQGQARKELFYKNCSKESNLNYLFHNLSSQMKGCKDNKAVRFEFKFTLYVFNRKKDMS